MNPETSRSAKQADAMMYFAEHYRTGTYTKLDFQRFLESNLRFAETQGMLAIIDKLQIKEEDKNGGAQPTASVNDVLSKYVEFEKEDVIGGTLTYIWLKGNPNFQSVKIIPVFKGDTHTTTAPVQNVIYAHLMKLYAEGIAGGIQLSTGKKANVIILG